MTRRLVATYLVLAAVVLIALEIPLGIVYQRSQHRDLQQRVERDAVALSALVEDTLQGHHTRRSRPDRRDQPVRRVHGRSRRRGRREWTTDGRLRARARVGS